LRGGLNRNPEKRMAKKEDEITQPRNNFIFPNAHQRSENVNLQLLSSDGKQRE